MNTLEKLKILSEAGKYDICSSTFSKRKNINKYGIGKPEIYGICQATTPSGCIHLLKTLYTNSCMHDCKYCINSAGCNKKTTFKPEELANLFMNFYLRNYVEGLFLSSGVGGDEDRIMGEMIDAIKILREKYNYNGYVHLKILPGVSREKIKESCEVADRISLNIETCNNSRFKELTTTKDYKIDILRRMSWIKENNVHGGATTQMIIGAANETDKENINMAHWLYKNIKLKRIYYSAFNPLKNTLMEKNKKTPQIREHRLYQVDWLMRVYKYEKNEVMNALDENGFIKLHQDPKVTLSENIKNVNINTANYDQLIRIPGIGPTGAMRIINIRRANKLNKKDLKQMGIATKRAEPYLEINGEKQLRITGYE